MWGSRFVFFFWAQDCRTNSRLMPSGQRGPDVTWITRFPDGSVQSSFFGSTFFFLKWLANFISKQPVSFSFLWEYRGLLISTPIPSLLLTLTPMCRLLLIRVHTGESGIQNVKWSDSGECERLNPKTGKKMNFEEILR